MPVDTDLWQQVKIACTYNNIHVSSAYVSAKWGLVWY